MAKTELYNYNVSCFYPYKFLSWLMTWHKLIVIVKTVYIEKGINGIIIVFFSVACHSYTLLLCMYIWSQKHFAVSYKQNEKYKTYCLHMGGGGIYFVVPSYRQVTCKVSMRLLKSSLSIQFSTYVFLSY